MLLAASGLVFVIACSNVANLILARSVRREGELAIRAALGASTGALRRTLLAESLLLCGAGARARRADRAADGGHSGALCVAVLGPRARSDGRFEHAVGGRRAGDHRRGAAGVRSAAALGRRSQGFGLASGSVRITGGTNRRLRVFAVTQIAASFVLLAGRQHAAEDAAGAASARDTGFDTQHVLAMNVPVMSYGKTPEQIMHFYEEAMRRIGELPGVDRCAVGTAVPWRDAALRLRTAVLGRRPREGDRRRRSARAVPDHLARIFRGAGRADHRRDAISTTPTGAIREPVVIVSQSSGAADVPGSGRGEPALDVDRSGDQVHRRRTGAAAHRRRRGRHGRRERRAGSDDDRLSPVRAGGTFRAAGCSCTRTRIRMRWCTPDHAHHSRSVRRTSPWSTPATLEDIRAEVLTPDRLNAAGVRRLRAVALAIAVVGVAGVLAFSVSARTREFGIRLAVGSQPQPAIGWSDRRGRGHGHHRVSSPARAAATAWRRLAGSYLLDMKMPSALPVAASALILLAAAVAASALPAARAARVDVIQALRSE